MTNDNHKTETPEEQKRMTDGINAIINKLRPALNGSFSQMMLEYENKGVRLLAELEGVDTTGMSDEDVTHLDLKNTARLVEGLLSCCMRGVMFDLCFALVERAREHSKTCGCFPEAEAPGHGAQIFVEHVMQGMGLAVEKFVPGAQVIRTDELDGEKAEAFKEAIEAAGIGADRAEPTKH